MKRFLYSEQKGALYQPFAKPHPEISSENRGSATGTFGTQIKGRPDFNSSGSPIWFSLPCFVIVVIGLSVIMLWLRLRSGSVWTSALVHASYNLWNGAFIYIADGAPRRHYGPRNR